MELSLTMVRAIPAVSFAVVGLSMASLSGDFQRASENTYGVSKICAEVSSVASLTALHVEKSYVGEILQLAADFRAGVSYDVSPEMHQLLAGALAAAAPRQGEEGWVRSLIDSAFARELNASR